MSIETDYIGDFGGETRRFFLGIEQLDKLDAKAGVGPSTQLQRLIDGSWRPVDLSETIRLGLIGGGLSPSETHDLLARHVDRAPKDPLVPLAAMILVAALRGRPGDVDAGEPGRRSPGASRSGGGSDRLRRDPPQRKRNRVAAAGSQGDEPDGLPGRGDGLERGAERGPDGSGGGRSVGAIGHGVRATFDGREVWLELPRAGLHMDSLETAVGSAVAALGRIGAGHWQREDVRLVLSHAWPGVVPIGRLTRITTVDRVLSVRPAGPYSILAHKILQACLLGIEQSSARWSEEEPA